jgi:hypothetical protein
MKTSNTTATTTTATKGLRRAALASLAALTVGAPCCGGGDFGSPAEVTELRVLAVTADKPYAAPGDTVTFGLTYADALGSEPRPLSVMWIGGCVNPIADDYLGCFAQFPQSFAAGLVANQMVAAEQSGVPNAVTFPMVLREDILETPLIAESGAPFSVAYAFFIVCAGTIQPTAADEGVESFPLECIEAGTGKKLGAESFVVGYTQVYVFADARPNTNPPALGMKLDGADIPEDAESAPVVEKCLVATSPQEGGGCGQPAVDDCKTYKVQAIVEDVAEVDPESSESSEPGGPPVKEAIWIDYFTDKGDITGFRQLVNDPATGYKPEPATTFTPPSEPGLVNLWAVVHDARGGSSVIRRVVRVE